MGTPTQAYSSYEIETAFYVDKEVGISASYKSNFKEKVLLISPIYSIGLFYDIK